MLAVLFLQKTQSSESPAKSVAALGAARPSAAAPASSSQARTTLGVLPLANYSGDSRQDYFADGMTEALITDLAQVEDLRVVSRTSSMQYRGSQKTMPHLTYLRTGRSSEGGGAAQRSRNP